MSFEVLGGVREAISMYRSLSHLKFRYLWLNSKAQLLTSLITLMPS